MAPGGGAPSSCVRVVFENFFNGFLKEPSDFEGEWQAGIKLAGFDGIDGLSGDGELLGEVGLGPVLHDSENFDTVFHW